MTFLKALILCMAVQGLAGSILIAIATGVALGQPFLLLSSDVAAVVFGVARAALASLFPSIAIVAGLIVLAPRVPNATPLQWVLGAALWSGGVWAGLGSLLVITLPAEPYLRGIALSYAFAGVISGAAVGWFMSLKKQPSSVERPSQA